MCFVVVFQGPASLIALDAAALRSADGGRVVANLSTLFVAPVPSLDSALKGIAVIALPAAVPAAVPLLRPLVGPLAELSGTSGGGGGEWRKGGHVAKSTTFSAFLLRS